MVMEVQFHCTFHDREKAVKIRVNKKAGRENG